MRRTLAVSLLALVCSTGIYAQAVVGSGAITGLVKDIYGDGIPDCTITLTNKSYGVRRTLMTSDSGIFDAPALVPGSGYGLKVTRRGYGDWELPSFDLSLGESLNFKITLYADKPTAAPDSMRALAAVQETKTSVSALVNDDQMADLPSKSRLLDNLALLAPAVTQAPSGVLVFRGEPWTNAFLYDGINTTNTYYLNHPGIAPFVTQESTSQMQVISAAAPAQFGHSPVGMFNTATKAGTNHLHASLYDYYSDNQWSKPDFFGGGFIPSGRLNQAGASVGLPVITDTLFVYGNLERVNNSSQGINHITNPLFTNAAGTQVSSASCTASAAQCSAAVAFIQNEIGVKVPMSQSSTKGFVRVDFRPGDSNSFTISSAIFSQRAVNGFDNATVAPNGGLYAANADTTNSTRFAAVGWTHVISPTTVNEFHGGWYRDGFTADTNSAQSPSTGPISITLAGTPLGTNPLAPINLREQRYGGTDSFTHTVAAHSMRFGAEVWRNQDTMDQFIGRFGLYNYTSLTAFASDYTANVKQLKNYATFTQTLGNSLTDLFSYSFHLYAEDDWRVLPGLTINAGLRWEKERLPQPTQPNPSNFNSEFIPSPNTNFSPRIGVAYLIDKRTVIRAGGGTYYQPFPGQLIRDLFADGGVYQNSYTLTPTAIGSPAFPKPLATTAPNTLSANYVTQFYTADRFRNPYTIQGSVAIERRLNRWVSLAASYMQSQGVKLWTTTDQNLPGGANVSEQYTINNAQGTSAGTYSTLVWNPAYAGRKYLVDTEASSRYRGATAQLRTAPIYGLTVQAAYTWSHSIDDVSAPSAFSIIQQNTFPGDYANDKANSAFDQRNRGVLNWDWTPRFTKSNNAISRLLINGWLVSGIATYASSMYQTPIVEVSGQQFTGVTMLYTTSLNGTGGWNRVPFQAINSLPIGKTISVDVRVSKKFTFTDRLNARLMFQAYNATNHQNNSAVNTIAYNAISGVLKPVPYLGAPIASYGYPFGTTARHMEVVFRLEF